jgi:hypothetical protein
MPSAPIKEHWTTQTPPEPTREATTETRLLPPGDGRLDPQEISENPVHVDTPSQRMRFAHALDERDRWRSCGTQARLAYSPSQQRYFVSASTCKNRFCPACRVRRQMALHDALARYFVNCPPKQWQFISLTLKHTSAPLTQQLDFLQRCFKALRQHAVWHGQVSHGFAVIEVTRNGKTLQWHPHLHVLAHVRFLDWSKLRQAWAAITHGSNIIDCGVVRTEGDAIRYVLAYIGKPPPESVLHDDAAMIEMYTAFHNQHLLIRFGRPPTKPPKAEPHTLPSDLIWLGSVETLIDEAIGGSERARTHLERWLLQRRTDAASLHSPTLLAALNHRPHLPRTLSEAITYEADLLHLRSELSAPLPF